MSESSQTPVSLSVLVIGSGGREHALALALSRDPGVQAVHSAPGNPGMAALGPCHPVEITQPEAVAQLATDLGVNLVVIGPEAPLVAGVADAVRQAGIACFGPSAAAAQLEGSKAFAKQVMEQAGVPTARCRVCRDQAQVGAALDEFGPPYVVKDDGLAAGKGVIVTDDRQAALDHAAHCQTVVVEEYLDGPEASLFVITDGQTVAPLRLAQDFKRVGEADTGPNTGGMGSYCPLPWAPADLVDQILDEVVHPTLAQMRQLGHPFAGLLYVGLALTRRGPRVVEFNVRFGDPETEAILPLLESPLGQVLYAATTEDLADCPPLVWSDRSAVGVVLAARGYPGSAAKGGRIVLPADTGSAHTIQAGTALTNHELVAHGGRVLVVVGLGDDLAQAREQAYRQVDLVDFPDGFCRRDIAQRAIQGQILAGDGHD